MTVEESDATGVGGVKAAKMGGWKVCNENRLLRSEQDVYLQVAAVLIFKCFCVGVGVERREIE